MPRQLVFCGVAHVENCNCYLVCLSYYQHCVDTSDTKHIASSKTKSHFEKQNCWKVTEHI